MSIANAIASGDKREGLKADHTKVKFDRQIVSIALVNGAAQLISDDGDVSAICERWGFPVVSVQDLPLPPFLIPPPLLAGLEDDDAQESNTQSNPVSGGPPRAPESDTLVKGSEQEGQAAVPKKR